MATTPAGLPHAPRPRAPANGRGARQGRLDIFHCAVAGSISAESELRDLQLITCAMCLALMALLARRAPSRSSKTGFKMFRALDV